ncbi:uncharacterized protein LOC132257311 [Phlebotomus argentipes]|uniref:uncharacterized protein LOC132257311 n=1 Tax=Phlebotomus argentipes TaxID=94469 RepID=UPI002893821C|nr:uncharacterized protein LOC132257311 [Phlebotomus argentipes]
MEDRTIPDIILEHNMHTVRQDLLNLVEYDEANFQQVYANSQGKVRPILGRRGSAPEPQVSYSRKMSADSVFSDGLLFSKTTLAPDRPSYFDEVRLTSHSKCHGQKFSQMEPSNPEKKLNFGAINVFPKSRAQPKEKNLPQKLKVLEDSLLNFVNLSKSLNALQPMKFAVIHTDAGPFNGLNEYFDYLINLAIKEEYWISTITSTLNLTDTFKDGFFYLSHELYESIVEAGKFTKKPFRFEDMHELNDSIDALIYWIRVFYTFVWLMMRHSENVGQVQERNLFIGV